ncbi:zinc knuckle CX2CX4HX4C containing protein [Tanacetum coccineum]
MGRGGDTNTHKTKVSPPTKRDNRQRTLYAPLQGGWVTGGGRNVVFHELELMKRKNASMASTSEKAGSKNWNALSLYMGNGMRAAIEAIRSFDFILPSGLIIVLDNCHFAPTDVDPTDQSVDVPKSTFYVEAASAHSKDQPKVNSNFRPLVAEPVFEVSTSLFLVKWLKRSRSGGCPWLIRKSPIILKNWSMDTRLLKEELTCIPVWVKLHDVPIQVFEEDGISLIATFVGKLVMLDSYTSFMCKDSWGRSSFARCLIEVNSEVDLVDVVTIGIPSLTGDGCTKETIHVEYEWKPPRCDLCKIFGHDHDHCPKKVVTPPIVVTSNVVTPTVEKTNDGFQTVGKKKKKKGKSNSNNGGQFVGPSVKQNVRYEPKATTSAPKKGASNVGNASNSSSLLKNIDDFSRYGFFYLMKHKHEVFETFKVFQNEVENQLGKKIKAIRSDLGGEYLSHEFVIHMKSCGIVSQLTPPYTPQHNGVSERRNQTLLDMVRSMMNLTTLPKSFWGYALETAARILNMVSTKKVDRTSYEIWHGKTLNFSYLKVWGCEALVKRDTPDKLDSRSIKCIFVGEEVADIVKIKKQRSLLNPSLIARTNTIASWYCENTSEAHNEVAPIEVEPQNVGVPIRRSTWIPQVPNRYGYYVDVEEYELGDLDEPPNYKVALADPESDKCLEAMNTKMQSMKDNQVWYLVDLPSNG